MIQYLDSQGNQLLTAGEEWGSDIVWKDFELQQGERVIGIQANANDDSAWIWDIQFVIGRLGDQLMEPEQKQKKKDSNC